MQKADEQAPPRCRPGDVALVIRAVNKANLGRIVSVLRLQGPDDWAQVEVPETVWYVEGAQQLIWSLHDRLIERRDGPVPDSCLLPLRDDLTRAADREWSLVSKAVPHQTDEPAIATISAAITRREG